MPVLDASSYSIPGDNIDNTEQKKKPLITLSNTFSPIERGDTLANTGQTTIQHFTLRLKANTKHTSILFSSPNFKS
jgi:hypothetical protein